MKLALVGLAAILFAVNPQQRVSNSNAALQTKITTLEKQVSVSKPGLGEIMGVIQQHHIKLYYAGTKANWPLAAYELGEVQESLEDAMQLYPNRFGKVPIPLPQIIPAMTIGTIAGLQQAIQQKDEAAFVKAYQALSRSCTGCHAAENHPFIRIQTPEPGMFSDQVFRH